MQITWYGQSCFKIVSGQNTIIIDPFKKDVGLVPPRGKVDVLLVSDSDILDDDIMVKYEFKVVGAGEYETKNIHINAFSEFYKNDKKSKKVTAYVVDVEGVRICHVSDFSKEFITKHLDGFGDVDLLMLPVGGSYEKDGIAVKSLNSDDATSVIGDIDPRVVIPMNFKVPGLKLKLDELDKFAKSFGINEKDKIDKYTIKKRDLPSEGRDVVLMSLS